MGGTKVLIGSSSSSTASTAAPFDVQYQYINNLAPLEACMTSCKADASCGGWWGCWQWNERPPGSQYPGDLIENLDQLTWQGQPHPQLTYWTYYSLRFLAGGAEGQAEIDNLNDSTKLARYFTDFRFLLQKIGTRKTMVHLEPDFWGFVRSKNSNPHAIPAKVNEANPTDCPAQSHENSVAGFARCMITMVRKYAPNSAVGLHASPWTHGTAGDAQALASFMNALGAGATDFVATDPSDRDAGWYEVVDNKPYVWWDDQKFAAYLAWSKTLSEAVGKPGVMWQVPLGNMSMDNTYQHYKDNKVDYLFSRIDDVAAAHVAGLLFGSGDTPQTHIDSDGGNLVNKTKALWQAGGATLR